VRTNIVVSGKTRDVTLEVVAKIVTADLTRNEVNQIRKVLGTKLMNVVTELPYVHLSLVDVKVR